MFTYYAVIVLIASVFPLWLKLCWCNRLNFSVASGKFPKNSVTLRFFTNSYISNISTYDYITYHSVVSAHIPWALIYVLYTMVVTIMAT